MGIWKFKLYLIKQLIIRDSQKHMKVYDFTTEGKKKIWLIAMQYIDNKTRKNKSFYMRFFW